MATETKKQKKNLNGAASLEIAPVDKITQALVKENITDRVLTEMKKQYMGLTIAGIDDKDGYKAVHEARMKCKNTRVLASKICKAGREDAIAEQKRWIEKEKEVTGQIEEVENHLQAEQDRIDAERERIKREKEEAEQARVQSLVTALTDLGCSFNGVVFTIGELKPISFEGIKLMPVDMWNELVAEVETEAKRLADLQAAEEARIQAEKEEQERQQREEQERLQREREELQRIKDEQERERQELQKQKDELEKTRVQVQKARSDKRCSELSALGFQYNFEIDGYSFQDKIEIPTRHITGDSAFDDEAWKELISRVTIEVKKINDAIEAERLEAIEEGKRLAAEQERQRIEDERQAEETRKQEEEAERQRLEALKPDKEKLLVLGNAIVQIPLPDVNTEAAKAIKAEVQELLNKIQMHIVKRVKSL